ncbi:hypothetical protein PCAR4_1490001 [Paraburkholderia caribensis]|nr:hypothetical protein PCAR4_1490001 [Paraburkholderia caribensis]
MPWLVLVANALTNCITHPKHPYNSKRRRTGMRRPGGKLCAGRSTPPVSLRTDSARVPRCKSPRLPDATTYTQFATWAAVDYLARRAVLREREAGEAHCKSAGNERGSLGCRVKRKNLWGHSGKHKDWRC